MNDAPSIPSGSAPSGSAPYSSLPGRTRGRVAPEAESPTRTCWQRDRDRIVHSGAFRKLKYKTQVFIFHEGDYYRTRLTHSLEVAQICRSICRTMGLNEDLGEAVALAHDLGHTPFGHAGERALNRCMAPYDGFAHNDQTLRILIQLERRYAEFDGLNLTWEALEGVVKHNGPLLPLKDGETLPVTIRAFNQVLDLELETWPGLEAQVAALADDIAYNNHDLDDGLRAGFFTFEEVAELPLVGPIVRELRDRYPGLEQGRLIHETIRRMINLMVDDLMTETRRRLADARPANVEELRRAGRAMAAFSDDMFQAQKVIRSFLWKRLYRDYRVNREMSKGQRVVSQLFELFMAEPNTLPTPWQEEITVAEASNAGDPMFVRARLVGDYIAGMTDRFALAEHRRLFDMTPRV